MRRVPEIGVRIATSAFSSGKLDLASTAGQRIDPLCLHVKGDKVNRAALSRFQAGLVGPRPRCVEQMPAGDAKPKRLQALLRDLRRMDLRDPESPTARRAEPAEELLQTGSPVLDQGAEGDDLSSFI